MELTIARHLDEMDGLRQLYAMAGRFAETLEQRWGYRGQRHCLRAVIRLTTESLVRSLP